jgi:hypothetical protein
MREAVRVTKDAAREDMISWRLAGTATRGIKIQPEEIAIFPPFAFLVQRAFTPSPEMGLLIGLLQAQKCPT